MSVSVESFFAAVEHRRTYYNITAASPISDEEIKALVERAVKHAPNAFNMQESRAIILTGKHHAALWEMVTETFLKTLPEDGKAHAADKIKNEYLAGYGTIVFFEDDAVIEQSQKRSPSLKDVFPIWSENAAGILHYIVWTALEAAGLGCSLQHYGSYSEETQTKVNELFDLPKSWKSSAMMPFGTPSGPPGRGQPKVFNAVEGERVKVFFG